MTVRQRNKLLILSYFLGIASLHSKLHMQVLPPCGQAKLLHPHISMNGFRLSKWQVLICIELAYIFMLSDCLAQVSMWLSVFVIVNLI